MMFFSLQSPAARHSSSSNLTLLLLTSLAQLSRAFNFSAAPSPNLDLSQLGRVGIAGDFSGISLYQFVGQNQNGFSTSGSQSVLGQLPNGLFTSLASSDAGIRAMCSFVMHDGTMAGVIVGGNFTSLGGMETQGVALFNPNTSSVTPLPGLSGQVSALLCDQTTNTVFVGGSFKGANSTNAIAWVGTAGWTNLPFLGFNGPVTSISKAANGHIIFGGSFTGLGNASTPNLPDQQIINIAAANITSGQSTATTGFSNPKNIVCKTNGSDGAGNSWLLQDNTPGFWRADFGFGFQPTKLRLWNTHQDGRGTKTWRYTASPIQGIMNFTYTDPATGSVSSCSSQCPLSNDSSVPFMDFHFVNVIGMNGIQIDISDWYGSGGGLDGIELFENDIYSYAIEDFNEPACASIATASNASITGPWKVTPSSDSVAEYLSATSTGATINASFASVVFYPDIKQSGNYSVNMYTPGCLQDNTCASRGRVNITGAMASGSNAAAFQTELFQSNNFDKYDQIYFGYIEASSSSFRPSITLSPSSGQNNNLTIVALRVGFSLIESSGGLNSLFEWDPSLASVNTADFANSTFDKAGMGLDQGSGVKSIVTSGSTTFVGGNFSTSTEKNILGVNSTGTFSLSGGGLNAGVMSMYINGTILYVGGNFTNTSQSTVAGLNRVAAYDTAKNVWSPLGAGVNGRVCEIVPVAMNVTNSTLETVITITGNFDQILAFGSNQSISVSGFAVWVPSHNNWLQNVAGVSISITGDLTTSVDLPSGGTLFAGSIASSQLSANGAVELGSGLSKFPVDIKQAQTSSSTSLTKRATPSQNISGVVTGYFYEVSGRNVTVLGGHFSASATSGSTINNLIFINGSNSDTVTGIGSSLSNDSTVMALTVQGDTLYAGGLLSGNVNGAKINGLISYDLSLATFPTQPPALAGTNVEVFAIRTRPNAADVYVGGNFLQAGSLDCPAVCIFSTSTAQWNRPGSSLAGTANTMTWASSDSLIVGGSLTIGGNSTYLATYNAQSQTWAAFNGASSIPGPVTALIPATSDVSQIWVAGIATNGSAFLMKYDGSSWNSAGSKLGSGTIIRGLQVLSLTQSHDTTNLLSSTESLMLLGNISLPTSGLASAALFNGTTFTPFLLTSSSGGSAGSLSQIFTQQQFTFSSSTAGHLALWEIVLVGLAISLLLIFLMVLAGIIAERIRRKREGYLPAPTNMFDRTNQMSRLPPEQIFGTVGRSTGRDKGAPMI